MSNSEAPPPCAPIVSAAPSDDGAVTAVHMVWPVQWITSAPGRAGDVHVVVQGADDAVLYRSRIVDTERHVLDLRDLDPDARHSVHHALGDAHLAPAVRFRIADLKKLFKTGDAEGLAGSIDLVVPPYPEPGGDEGSG